MMDGTCSNSGLSVFCLRSVMFTGKFVLLYIAEQDCTNSEDMIVCSVQKFVLRLPNMSEMVSAKPPEDENKLYRKITRVCYFY